VAVRGLEYDVVVVVLVDDVVVVVFAAVVTGAGVKGVTVVVLLGVTGALVVTCVRADAVMLSKVAALDVPVYQELSQPETKKKEIH